MGKMLTQWFIYSLIVGVFSAYIGVQSLAAGAEYLSVMQIFACSAFAAYAMGLIQNSIWYARDWSVTLKFLFDGLVYALLTGGIFAWLWPVA